VSAAAAAPAPSVPTVEQEYHAYGAAAALFRAQQRNEVVLAGPAGTGKTRSLLVVPVFSPRAMYPRSPVDQCNRVAVW
jgi:hypothetical protein